jgi:MFS family permease
LPRALIYPAGVFADRYGRKSIIVPATVLAVGYVVGPIVLGIVADGFGASAALMVAAVMLAGVALLFARAAPEPRRMV